MESPWLTLQKLWEEGTAALDEAAELLERGEEGAGDAHRLARHRLLAAQRLAAEVGEGRYPIDEELHRLERLGTKISSDTLDPDAPRRQLIEFDAAVGRGDEALKKEESQLAVIEYLRAFEILEESLNAPVDSDTLAEDDCRLCWDTQATTTIRFCGQTVPACHSCEADLSGRFPSDERVQARLEALRDDIEAALDWSRGPDWLSTPPSAAGDGVGTGEMSDSPTSESDHERTIPETVFLIRDFTAVSQRVEHPAEPSDIVEHGEYDPEDYREAFGSWDAILSEAGFTDEE